MVLAGHRQQLRIPTVPLPQVSRLDGLLLGQGNEQHLVVIAPQRREA